MKALFVGLDNPQSSDPRYALYPAPSGCAGYNLFQMMKLARPDFSLSQYVNIPKTNLFPVGMAPRQDTRNWRRAAGRVLIEQLADTGRRVFLFGNDVRDAVFDCSPVFGDPQKTKPMAWIEARGFWVCWLPHPSGRNYWYNEKGRKLKVGRFLIKEVCREK